MSNKKQNRSISESDIQYSSDSLKNEAILSGMGTVVNHGEHMTVSEYFDKVRKALDHRYNKLQLIAICGLDCSKCDAFIATKNNDQVLREKTARLWSELNHVPILPEYINCEGCRMYGAKTVFCSSLCEIRKCAVAKGYGTCGECSEKETCPKVGVIWQHNPQAKENLKE